MSELTDALEHLKGDIESIHDHLEHLNSHSIVCSDLVREANLREASELFEHLQEIDGLIHGVQQHVEHINEHLAQDAPGTEAEGGVEPLDVDDLKHDTIHAVFDLKDIHAHIEHLIKHTEMCQNILNPHAEEELGEVKVHLTELDEYAHELLEHIQAIRGNISSKFSEFIWSIPAGAEDAIQPNRLMDSDSVAVKEMALRLVDGCDDIQCAALNILCFVRDFIPPGTVEDSDALQGLVASNTLECVSGGGCAKTILACSLARAVSIPSRVHIASISMSDLGLDGALTGTISHSVMITVTWPEFLIGGKWTALGQLFDSDFDFLKVHADFIELGMVPNDMDHDLKLWEKIPEDRLLDHETLNDPVEYLLSQKYMPPPSEIERRLFGGYIYTGTL